MCNFALKNHVIINNDNNNNSIKNSNNIDVFYVNPL